MLSTSANTEMKSTVKETMPVGRTDATGHRGRWSIQKRCQRFDGQRRILIAVVGSADLYDRTESNLRVPDNIQCHTLRTLILCRHTHLESILSAPTDASLSSPLTNAPPRLRDNPERAQKGGKVLSSDVLP